MGKLILGLLLLAAGQLAAAADLLSVYERALAEDAKLAAARAVRDAALEARPLAKAGLLPNLSASASASYQDRDADGGVITDDSFSSGDASLSLTQALYRRDRMVRVEQADLQVAAAEADYSQAEQDLILRVAKAYFGVLSAQDNLTFVQAEKKAIERQLDQAKQRFEVGLIAITGVHEAQARFDQSRADEIVARNELDNAREALREIIGETPDDLAGLVDGLPLQPPVPAQLAEWSRKALENNPTVLSNRFSTEVAKQEVEVQRAARQPTVDLFGSYNLNRTNSTGGSDLNTATVGVQLAVPLYTGGSISAAIRQALANYEAAREGLDSSRKAVDRQARDAFRGVLASISRVHALKATTVSAQSALDATTAGFDVGTRTLVDVLNSQRDLYRAQRDYAQSKYDYILNRFGLELAAGTLDRADLETMNNWLN